MKKFLIIFLISMVPLIELRGAIPVAVGMGLPIIPAILVSVVGNMIPVPGTGAWTGTLAASILNMDFRKSVLYVLLGILLAGAIMIVLSLGVFGAISLVK